GEEREAVRLRGGGGARSGARPARARARGREGRDARARRRGAPCPRPHEGAQRLMPAACDLVVIGGGINGAGIARDAALRGLSVCLLEQDDLCSSTTRWSSRLIHGGLRYLEFGELGLVHESLRERETLLAHAPHLVRPLPLVIPVYRHGKRGLNTVDFGL